MKIFVRNCSMLVAKKEARPDETYIAVCSDEGNLLSYFSQLCGLKHFLFFLRKSQLAEIIQSSETPFWNESHLVVKSVFSVFEPKWVKLSSIGQIFISGTSFEGISGSHLILFRNFSSNKPRFSFKKERL